MEHTTIVITVADYSHWDPHPFLTAVDSLLENDMSHEDWKVEVEQERYGTVTPIVGYRMAWRIPPPTISRWAPPQAKDRLWWIQPPHDDQWVERSMSPRLR